MDGPLGPPRASAPAAASTVAHLIPHRNIATPSLLLSTSAAASDDRRRVGPDDRGVGDRDDLVHRQVRQAGVLADRLGIRGLVDADGADAAGAFARPTKAVLGRVEAGADPVGRADLGVDVLDVVTDGLGRDLQPGRDLLGLKASGDPTGREPARLLGAPGGAVTRGMQDRLDSLAVEAPGVDLVAQPLATAVSGSAAPAAARATRGRRRRRRGSHGTLAHDPERRLVPPV